MVEDHPAIVGCLLDTVPSSPVERLLEEFFTFCRRNYGVYKSADGVHNYSKGNDGYWDPVIDQYFESSRAKRS